MATAYGFIDYGGPETQQFLDVPVPTPGPGQLLVAVHAAGVNPADWKVRSGKRRDTVPVTLPAVLGREVAGVVGAGGGVGLGGGGVTRRRTSEVFAKVAELVSDGTLDPRVEQMFPLSRAGEALAEVESGHARGKIVIVVR